MSTQHDAEEATEVETSAGTHEGGAPADDPFEGGPAADPFEEASAASAEPPADVPAADESEPLAPTADPAASEAIPAADIPVVDKEGAPVEPQTAVPANPHDPPAPPLPATATAAGRAKAAEEASAQAAESAQDGAQGDEAADDGAAPLSDSERGQATEGSGSRGPGQRGEEGDDAQDGGSGEEEAASGKQTRYYKALYQTADKGWTEVDLSNAPADQKTVLDGEEFLVARNNDHARRLLFNILGRPDAGVTVNPIARASWKPKRVRVAPPKPDRERLEIE